MAKHPIETIEKAKALYLQDYSIRKIAEALNIPAHCTIELWKNKYKWKKAKPDYPINSLKAQLARCTKLVDILEPALEKINILKPTQDDKEILANYRRLSDLQLKLVKQLSVLVPIDRKPPKKNIFL